MTRAAYRALLIGLAMLYPTGAYMGASAEPVLRWVRPAAEMPAPSAPLASAAPTGVAPASLAPMNVAATSVPRLEARMGLSRAIVEASARPHDATPLRVALAKATAATDAAADDTPVVRASFTVARPDAGKSSDAAKPAFVPVPVVPAPSYSKPWRSDDNVFVLDGYEFNELDWGELAKDERIRGFIHKASDGMPEVYDCRNGGLMDSSPRHCKTRWRKYSVTKELYKTRRAMAKALGWKWGAYHMGRPGNPEAQADHFIEFADPQPDEFIAIDLEDNDPDKWMSLEETERFARRVHQRIGRWPALYTNGSTAKHIARNRETYPILSRLPLWYARFRPEIEGVFPMGNWESYHSWQFLAQVNCNRSCAMRPKGTNKDIDVNVVNATPETLDAMWATKDLLPVRGEPAETRTLMVDAAPAAPADATLATAFAPEAGSAGRVKAVFDEVLRVEDTVKAKMAPGVPTPMMRPGE